MNRVLFVGIHSKLGKPPLCSTTKTGKIIDSIIEGLEIECIKTNLFKCNFIPVEPGKKAELMFEWFVNYNPDEKTIVVLLGNTVDKNFRMTVEIYKKIKIFHPGYVMRQGKKFTDQYIEETIDSIKSLY